MCELHAGQHCGNVWTACQQFREREQLSFELVPTLFHDIGKQDTLQRRDGSALITRH